MKQLLAPAHSAFVVSALIALSACSSDKTASSTTPKVDSGPPGNGGSSNTDSGGVAGKQSGDSGSTTDSGSTIVRTSAACGSVPINGDFGADSPPDCVSCVEQNCCAEATACGSDAECLAFRECASPCQAGDTTCVNACASQHPPGPANGPLNSCRQTCGACVLTTCVTTPFVTAPGTKTTVTWHLFNFVSGKGVADLSVKICDPADTDCATPLQVATTDANGDVTVDMPNGPKWTTAYLEVTGADIVQQMNFPRGRGALVASMAFPVLDTATASAFTKLAGGTPIPDGGTDPNGSLGIQSDSCVNSVMAGVTFESSNGGPDLVTSYIKNGLPSTTATETTGAGQAGMVNHAPGKTTLTMKDAKTGKVLGTSDVIVRAGWYTTTSVPVGP